MPELFRPLAEAIEQPPIREGALTLVALPGGRRLPSRGYRGYQWCQYQLARSMACLPASLIQAQWSPEPAVMPLVAVTVADVQTKDWRSRPGLEPPVFADIVIEGLEEESVSYSTFSA